MKNNLTLYKVLVDGKSCHGGNMEWSLPKKVKGKWVAGKWHRVEGELSICQKGIHLTTKPYNWYKWGCTKYLAETKNVISWQDDKCVCNEVRLLKEVPHPKWWTDICNWIETLKNIAWLRPDGKPKKEWKLFETRAAAWDAARAAAWDAAWDAAGDAAWDAAGDAAGDAARAAAWDAAWDAAGDAAWDAAGDAAWDAAEDAAWDAAGDAAWDAAGDAVLYARGIIVADLKLESKHRTHIKKRMEVWQKGYGLLCDVNGVLYCYKKLK